MSNSMQIKLSDYVSDEEIKATILDEIRRFTRNNTETTLKRIFSNGAYEILSQCIDKNTSASVLEELANTVNRLLTDKASIQYQLFKQPDQWNREPSMVARVFSDCVFKRGKEIAEAVDKHLATLNAKDFKTFLIRYAVKEK